MGVNVIGGMVPLSQDESLTSAEQPPCIMAVFVACPFAIPLKQTRRADFRDYQCHYPQANEL